MHKFVLLLLFSLFLAGCGAPRPATIKETGLKPVNSLKYYNLTDSERKKFERQAQERAERRNIPAQTSNPFGNDASTGDN